MDRLSAYRQPPVNKSRKTPGNAGIFVAVGGATLLILVIFLLARPSKDPTTVWGPPPSSSSVKLSERTRREMYVSLCSLRDMLRGVGTSNRRFLIIAERFGITETQAREVEAEGASKNWPQTASGGGR